MHGGAGRSRRMPAMPLDSGTATAPHFAVMGAQEVWTEDRVHRAVIRYARFARVKAALAKLVMFACTVAAAVTLADRGILWAVAVLIGGPLAASLIAFPLVLILGYAMCGRDGMRVGRHLEAQSA